MSGITATSWVDVAPSELAMGGAEDSPSRGMMMPMPGLSTSAPPPPIGAPTPHEALIQGQQQLLAAAQRSADAHELAARAVSSTARDSRITADASERADAKLRPNAFREKYETRRWVACNDGDHTGYKGYDERSDSLVSEELGAVLGSDLPAPRPRSNLPSSTFLLKREIVPAGSPSKVVSGSLFSTAQTGTKRCTRL